MKKLKIAYGMKINFTEKIFKHYFSLRCIPKNEARQQIGSIRIRLNADYFAYSSDGFGNRLVYGYKQQPHKLLDLYLETEATVDWEKYDTNCRLNSIFLLPTAPTAVGTNLSSFCDECHQKFQHLSNDYDKAIQLMKEIHSRMQYVKGSTDIKTPAEEAFSKKKGVCQDYAQIMIATARKLHIPARYVAGIMENETLTHAWVEIFANNRWYGFDPTNNLLVNDSYVVFSRGRDYSDCLVNKGLFFGAMAKQVQDIEVQAKYMEE